MQPYPSPESATTGPDGRFHFLADRQAALHVDNEKYLYRRPSSRPRRRTTGSAGWRFPPDGRSDDLTLRLVDDRPITGQFVDLEGKPVPGANPPRAGDPRRSRGDLGPWLEAAKGQERAERSARAAVSPAGHDRTVPEVTTDAEGRFRLTGIGRNRLVMAQLDGPTIVSEFLRILTRPGEPFNVTGLAYSNDAITTYYGAEFRQPRPRRSRSRAWSATGTEEAAGRDHRYQLPAGE